MPLPVYADQITADAVRQILGLLADWGEPCESRLARLEASPGRDPASHREAILIVQQEVLRDQFRPHHAGPPGSEGRDLIRHSSPQQVISHQESLRLQYDLRQKAIAFGWPETAIDVIDCDLGRTAHTTRGRVGFAELVSRVTLGDVGIIFSYDVTRLSRNCSDWYQLLDLCGFRQCLIGDHDGIYDPSSINGRMLLGLKGQISELELHAIKARLHAGLINKAHRGELAQSLPVGLVRDLSGRVVKHPDQEVGSGSTSSSPSSCG